MYEHFRNSLLFELTNKFNSSDINYIFNALDKIALNFNISEKETALSVIEDNIPKLVKLYIASKHLEGCAKTTLNLYFSRLKTFFETVNKQPQEIQTNDVRMFLFQYQLQVGISDRTLEKFRQILNGFFEWCLNEEYITKNPCKNIHEIKYEVKPRHSLTRLQLEQVRRLCKTKRDLAIVDTLYSTGCRVSELINMKFNDVDFINNSIHIIGKGGKHNIVYLNTNSQLSLNDYINTERKGNSDYIFVSYRSPFNGLSVRSIQNLFDDMNVNFKISPHILRHTSATLALQSGMPITQVQKMLGHSSVATTQIYAETSQEDIAISHKRYVI